MTGRHNDAVSRWAAVAIAALLLLSALAIAGCSLDPDGGASLTVAKEYAPTPVKLSVLDSMKVQGFSISSYLYTYVVYPSLEDTKSVLVTGLMYGPSGQKGVLDTYKALNLTIDDAGFWKINTSVKGTPPADQIGPSEEGTGVPGSTETSGASETSQN
jgi:hypothetical protein